MDINLFIDVVFSLLCAVTIVWTCLALNRMRKIKAKFNAAIVLIPLYKRNHWIILGMVLLSLVIFADAILLYLYLNYIIVTASVLVISASIMLLLVSMLRLRCAVLDSGVVVPFRYIDWTRFYDYSIEKNTIFFCCDDQGYDTIGSVSPKMVYDGKNREKLEYILSKHRK